MLGPTDHSLTVSLLHSGAVKAAVAVSFAFRNYPLASLCHYDHPLILFWSIQMAKVNLSSMSVEALLQLRDDVGRTLARKANLAQSARSSAVGASSARHWSVNRGTGSYGGVREELERD